MGYEFQVGPGDPLIKTALFPVGIGDGQYDLFVLENGVWTLLAKDVFGGATFTFGGEGVARFVVQGIEPGAGLDPGDPTAFVTAIAFTADGTFNGRMVPLLQAVH